MKSTSLSFIVSSMCIFTLMWSGCNSGEVVGDACRGDGDCADRCVQDFPGGFCTVSCRDDVDCPRGTVCADAKGGICLFPCDSDAQCEDVVGSGYECDDEDTFDDRKILVCKE